MGRSVGCHWIDLTKTVRGTINIKAIKFSFMEGCFYSGMLGLQQSISRLADAAKNYINLEGQSLNGPANFQTQLGQAMAADILEFDVLQETPDALFGIQVECIRWQGLERQTLG